ncbi:hypothetical protein FO519_002516 [Halicephalobus sp. NKZ332]|nr:hypothetical protein FO519_002516 [Halicephalobus sp. NKZ332]
MESHQVSLRKLVEYFDNVVSVVGFCLNLTLLYLIIYKTSFRLRDYRPILLQNCLIDIFFNIINTMTKTQVDQKNGNFYMYMIGPLENITAPYNNLLICLWVFSLFYCLTGVPVQFVYRYILIVRASKVTFVHYFSLLISALLAALIYALWTVYTFLHNEPRWKKASVLLQEDPNYSEGLPNFVVASIDEWPLRILFIYAYFLVCVVYIITIFSSTKVWRHLKSMENQMTVQVQDAHRQITVTLFFQAIIPCVVSLIPIITAVTMAFIHGNVPGLGLILALLYTAIPIVNPLLTLIVVRNYRRNAIYMIEKICGKRNTRVEPTTAPMTHQGVMSKTSQGAPQGTSSMDFIEQFA